MSVPQKGEAEGLEIQVRLHGVFRIGRFKEEFLRFPAGVRARNVIETLQLPESLLGIVVINDLHASADAPLHDGDILALFPLLDGG